MEWEMCKYTVYHESEEFIVGRGLSAVEAARLLIACDGGSYEIANPGLGPFWEVVAKDSWLCILDPADLRVRALTVDEADEKLADRVIASSGRDNKTSYRAVPDKRIDEYISEGVMPVDMDVCGDDRGLVTSISKSFGLDVILRTMKIQVRRCESNEANFSAKILEVVCDNLSSGGALASLVVPWRGDAGALPNPHSLTAGALAEALPRRICGVLHYLVRTGRAPGLATFYPGYGDASWDTTLIAGEVESAVAANSALVRAILLERPRTYEPGHTTLLMLGYHEIAERTGLLLRILEVQAGAGLNLIWDRYGYRCDHRYGDFFDKHFVDTHSGRAQFVINADWSGPWPEIDRLPRVAERRGCDNDPIDLRDHDARDRFISYEWPDQPDRFASLEAAISRARWEKSNVDKANAAEWLKAQLAEPAAKVATVVVSAIAWDDLPKKIRAGVCLSLDAVSRRATDQAPLAWLSLRKEWADTQLELTLWPGGQREVLAKVKLGRELRIEWLRPTGGDGRFAKPWW